MVIGTVIGNVWATRKEEGLTGLKFLIIQPDLLLDEGRSQHHFVAVDQIGAGIGDRVLVAQGFSASHIENKQLPIDALVIGIIDSIETKWR